MAKRLLPAAALSVALALSGCGAANDAASGVASVLNMGAGPDKPPPAPVEDKPDVSCPQVYVLPDKEVIRREAAGGGAGALQWQATIGKTARECKPGGQGVVVRVGISGRLVQGAKGGSGTLRLPVRVAVREGDQTTYDKTHTITVQLDAPSKDWAFVDENVTVSTPRRAQIFVGFNET
ncbi:hypothetical protein [Acuticoccus sediminis]|uniref:hypothetical protein n=1 Tax=Acuticoccus sediminis TaxID=2184697 RepID=UPI001CFD2E1E|nr:hypothetical protein [Acuticoccus sediminis]